MATGGESDIEKGADETFDFLCSVCTRNNKTSEAVKFCTDCQEYFCPTCVRWHNDFPALKHHQTLDKEMFQPGPSSVQFPVVPTERCKQHGYKPVDMYCGQHDTVGCSTCIVTNHSGCKDKHYIPEYIKNDTKVDPKDTTNTLDTITDRLSKLQTAFLEQKAKITNSKESSLKLIRKLRNEVNQRIDELEKSTVQELERHFKSLYDKMEATLKDIQAAFTEMKSAKDSLQSAVGNMSQMFVSIKLASVAVSHANEVATAAEHQVSLKELSFVSDQKLCSLFSDIQFLGSIILNEQSLSETPISSSEIKTAITASQCPSSPPLMQIRGSKKYGTKVWSDRTNCYVINSACALEDGTIILCDINNKNLKRLDSSTYAVTDSCDLQEMLWQVCAISNQQVAVTKLNKRIAFVSIGPYMRNTHEIRLDFLGLALAYGDGKLFIGDENTSVYVFSLSGEKLQQFPLPLPHYKSKGITIFSIAVRSDNSAIYVADTTKKGFIILDKNGQLIGEFSDPRLVEPCAVCLCKNDNYVLVSGQASNNLLQFRSYGNMIGEVLKRDIRSSVLCWCKKSSKLIIGGDQDIEIYDTVIS